MNFGIQTPVKYPAPKRLAVTLVVEKRWKTTNKK